MLSKSVKSYADVSFYYYYFVKASSKDWLSAYSQGSIRVRETSSERLAAFEFVLLTYPPGDLEQ